MFDFVMVDELFRIATGARQVRHEPGREVYHEGEHPDSVQFLIEGTVYLRAGETDISEVSRPAALAFEEVLEGRPLDQSLRAADRAVCLSIPRDHFLTVLSDNVEVAQGLFRLLLERPQARRWRIVCAPPAGADRVAPSGVPLQAADKMRLLRRIPLFSRALVTQLLDVVGVARETPLRRGQVLLEATDEPAMLHVLDGELLVEGGGAEPIVAGPGSTVGMAETLAGEPLHRRVTARGEGLVLRLDRAAFYDVAADHVGLLQGLFSALLQTEDDVQGLTTGRHAP
jgi:CRP-like cAMP-binding protein